MKEYRIFYIVILLIATAMLFAYSSRMMPVLLFVLIFCPAASFVLALVGFFRLKVRTRGDDLVLRKNEEGALTIDLQNRFILPLTPVRIRGRFQSDAFTEKAGMIAPGVMLIDVSALGRTSLELPVCIAYRGEYTVGVESVEVFDLFRLFKFKKKMGKKIRVIVLPREFPLDKIKDINEAESAETAAALLGINKSDSVLLREYRTGDSLKQIHWKLSAKQDELIVRQPEPALNNSSLIFCDFTGEYGEEARMALTDAVIETALALARRIVSDNNTAALCWNNAEDGLPTLQEAGDFEQYYLLFYRMALLPARSRGSFYDLFEVAEGEDERMIYIVTPELTSSSLKRLETAGFTARGDVVLALIRGGGHDPMILDYVKNKTTMRLVEIRENDIAESLSPIMED